MVKALGTFVVRRARIIIALPLLVNAAGLVSFTRARMDTSLLSLFDTGEATAREYRRLSAAYGSTDMLLLLLLIYRRLGPPLASLVAITVAVVVAWAMAISSLATLTIIPLFFRKALAPARGNRAP